MSSQPSAIATDRLDPIFNDFLRRWRQVSDLIVSPVDRSALHIHGSVLRDASGNSFPILDGAPVLLPDLQRLLTDHYAICMQAGPPPTLLTQASVGPDDIIIECYLFGRLLKLGELRPAETPSTVLPSGTLEIVGDETFIWSAGGRLKVNRLWYNAPFGPLLAIEDGPTLIKYFGVTPPYFVLKEKFPSVNISTYYELLPFLRISDLQREVLLTRSTQPLDASDSQSIGSDQDLHHAAEEADRFVASSLSLTDLEADAVSDMTLSNAVFFQSVFDHLKIDLVNGGVLDVGGGTGFIVAAMEMAGARRPLSFDVRRPDLICVHELYPTCRNMIVAFADMFHWCFSDDAYSLIAVRNNGPICFATDLKNPALADFLKNCINSLRDDGILYLTAITGESQQVDSSGLANRTVAEYIDWVESSGLHVLRLSKLGTQLALLCCKTGARDVFIQRMTNARWVQRARAWREYRSGDNDRRTLLNFFLAVGDLAGEIALEAYRKRATGIALCGNGVLSYYLWRHFYVSFPKLNNIAFVTAQKSGSSAQPQYTPDEAVRQLGDRCINVLADDSYYDQVVSGRKAQWPYEADHVLVPPNSSAYSADSTQPWLYSLVTGDHDVVLPKGMAGYFGGRVRGLISPQALAEGIEFEFSLKRFPTGYRGEPPVGYRAGPDKQETGLRSFLRKFIG